MKKAIKILALLSAFLLIFCSCGFGSNDKAQKDKKGRYLTIINKTDEIINEVHVTVTNGTEIESMQRTNPDETSFSLEIPEQYSDYDAFKVILVDRYGLKYERVVTNVGSEGRTEVTISEDDCVEEEGNISKKINRWFNKNKDWAISTIDWMAENDA